MQLCFNKDPMKGLYYDDDGQPYHDDIPLDSKVQFQELNVFFTLNNNPSTFSLRTSCISEVSLEMLLMISDVVASCESKNPTSCLRTASRNLYLILITCLSLVLLQQYPSAKYTSLIRFQNMPQIYGLSTVENEKQNLVKFTHKSNHQDCQSQVSKVECTLQKAKKHK